MSMKGSAETDHDGMPSTQQDVEESRQALPEENQVISADEPISFHGRSSSEHQSADAQKHVSDESSSPKTSSRRLSAHSADRLLKMLSQSSLSEEFSSHDAGLLQNSAHGNAKEDVTESEHEKGDAFLKQIKEADDDARDAQDSSEKLVRSNSESGTSTTSKKMEPVDRKQDLVTSKEKDVLASKKSGSSLPQQKGLTDQSRELESIAVELPLQRGNNLLFRDALRSPGAHSVNGPRLRTPPDEEEGIPPETNQQEETPEEGGGGEVLVSATLVKDDTVLAEPVREGRNMLRLACVMIVIFVLVGVVVSLALALRSSSSSSSSSDANNPANTTTTTAIAPVLQGTWDRLGKPIGGTAGNDFFGAKVAISGDGSTLLASAAGSNILAGSLRVFSLSNNNQDEWERLGNQQSLIGMAPGDVLGFSVATSRDGMTVAGGAIAFGDANENWGYVLVARFNQTAKEWQLLGDPIIGEEKGEQYGTSVSLSDDGNTVVIGAAFNGENGFESGKVKVYRYDGTKWQQLGDSKFGDGPGDEFGKYIVCFRTRKTAMEERM